MTLLDIRTWGDVRAFLHSAVPLTAAAAVTSGLLTEQHSLLWVALVLAVVDPAISWSNSTGFRKGLYAVLLAANAVLIGVFGLWTQGDIAPWLSLIPILLGGGVAAANTPTSTG
jgi:hypothetical protein